MKTRRTVILTFLTALIFLAPMQLLAEDGPQKSSMHNPVVQVFVIVIAALALCIGLLSYVLLGAAQFKLKEEKEKKGDPGNTLRTIAVIVFCLAGSGVFAAETPAEPVHSDMIGGMGSTTFYALLSVVIVELIILLGLLYNLMFLLRTEKAAVYREPKRIDWSRYWNMLNRFRPVKEEAEIDLGHDYDGIRELDNRLPPWWLYGFYACIVFAAVYLWQHEISHTAPSSQEEFAAAMQKGEEEKRAYLEHAASQVDENTVKLLTDEASLSSGKAIFTTVCAACHAADGGGIVGPNLTDDYWLHGGSLKDVFKTIKYGWQEKGMKSWKDDYTPVQIAQLASYVKSLHGKKPATPKEPQGELYKEPAATDSVSASLPPAKTQQNP